MNKKNFLLLAAFTQIVLTTGLIALPQGSTKHITYYPGFSKGLDGVDFNYRSPLPQNEDAYILRNTFQKNRMAWQTAPAFFNKETDTLAFVFMVAMSTDNAPLHHSLSTDAGDFFEFSNNQDAKWSVRSPQGGELTFFQARNLPGVEINGFMILKLPAGRVKSGQALDITVTLKPTNKNAWIIIFKKSLTEETTITSSPVLLKGPGPLNQQVTITQIQFANPAKVDFLSGNRLLHTNMTKIGYNKFYVPVPEVKSPRKTRILMKYSGGAVEELVTIVNPVIKWEIDLVQHSHTDIGYTRPQSEILAEHLRYIDYALDFCDQTDDLPDDAKFRWTCESAWVVREYLRTRPAPQIARLKTRISEGRIEVTGMYFNMAELPDDNLMYDFFQPLMEIRDHGIPVKTVMQNDVNGVAWCLPDYLSNTGVSFLSMGINEARSIRPFSIPTCFWWEAPSGNRLLAFRNDHYMTGNGFGLPDKKSFDPDKLFSYLKTLETGDYPYNRIAVQFSGYMTDNAPPSTGACEIVRDWNEKYASPKLRLSVASEFLEFIGNNHGLSLPVHRQAWLDWWTDGFGSTSRETARTREAQNIKLVDEGMFAMINVLNGTLTPSLASKIEHIGENALFFDEHTVGADESIDHPFSENTTSQWLQKGAYAWEALKKVTLLHEEALGQLQQYLQKAPFPVVYVINSLGWDRSGLVELFVDYQIIPANSTFRIIDLSTGQSVPVQRIRNRSEGAYWMLGVQNVPGMGWKAYRIEVDSLNQEPLIEGQEFAPFMENKFYKVVFDSKTGGIKSLVDKELNFELVDSASDWTTGQPVRETLTDRNNMKEKSHSSVTNVRMEPLANGQLWQSMRFVADIGGFRQGTPTAPGGMEWEIRLYKNVKRIEFRYLGRKEILTSPEALYVTFPFALPGARIVFETIGGTLSPGQQLAGSSSDWNVAQNFVSVRGASEQIVLVSDQIPLWQFGGFNLGNFERFPVQRKPWLWSWVMNNYWTTNFRAYQEGDFHWTYQMTSLRDTSNAAAMRFARGVRNPFPTRTFPATGTLNPNPDAQTMRIDASENVMVLSVRPFFQKQGSVLLNIREVNGSSGSVRVYSGNEGRPITKMVQVNSIGDEIGTPLMEIQLKAHTQQFIRIDF